jgi:hypothetical protein
MQPERAKSQNPAASRRSTAVFRLKEKSKEVKAKIEQEKRRHDLPLDSKLGNPAWEEKAADGHLDIPEQADD